MIGRSSGAPCRHPFGPAFLWRPWAQGGKVTQRDAKDQITRNTKQCLSAVYNNMHTRTIGVYQQLWCILYLLMDYLSKRLNILQ